MRDVERHLAQFIAYPESEVYSFFPGACSHMYWSRMGLWHLSTYWIRLNITWSSTRSNLKHNLQYNNAERPREKAPLPNFTVWGALHKIWFCLSMRQSHSWNSNGGTYDKPCLVLGYPSSGRIHMCHGQNMVGVWYGHPSRYGTPLADHGTKYYG